MRDQPTTPQDDELPGMLAVAKGIAEQTFPHTMDAAVWAAEFVKLNPGADEGLMLSWFANAIMAGYDTAQARATWSESEPILPPADANGKRPRLFYWEDAEDCWCPAEGLLVENIIGTDQFFSDGDVQQIRFKREDMTDAEFDAIPEG